MTTTSTCCLVIQHVEPEPAWAVGDALARAGVEADVRRLHAGDSLPPDLDGHAGLVVMGGPRPGLPVRSGGLGFQFHMEVTPPAVEGLVRAFPADDGGAGAVLAGTRPALAVLAAPRELVFDRFAALVGARTDPAATDGSPHRFADVSDS